MDPGPVDDTYLCLQATYRSQIIWDTSSTIMLSSRRRGSVSTHHPLRPAYCTILRGCRIPSGFPMQLGLPVDGEPLTGSLRLIGHYTRLTLWHRFLLEYHSDQVVWTYVGPLICFHLVEKHQQDRVLRQFNMFQMPPAISFTYSSLHQIDLRRKHDQDCVRFIRNISGCGIPDIIFRLKHPPQANKRNQRTIFSGTSRLPDASSPKMALSIIAW
ncbi:serine/threonine-protein phosphatase 7 long form-like protein [Cucumis melo var. makuwa]|uniref:Serine/threonine-protein phosphatase 7 long form-like protein n=1 Tax=Cucumis melo var. makuwa TaxID=1194695 RepID=A0A5D3E7X1_CUCMM|nr:serine/threonine-protein phosphatase 7 long form-like protein [Cucumis melo var. makuwa]